MTEQQLEKTLRSAMEHAAPDRLDAILSRCGPQERPAVQARRENARPPLCPLAGRRLSGPL